MQKTTMTDFLEKLEILIDQLILHLPSEWFIDAPFLAILLSNPNGRYVLAGFLLLIGLSVLWAILLVLQVLFSARPNRNEPAALQTVEKQSTLTHNKGSDGFQFFKRRVDGGLKDDDAALKAIELEMVDVRQKYQNGQMLQDVYVAETRRLYNSAKAVKP